MAQKNFPKSRGFTVFLIMSFFLASFPGTIHPCQTIDVTPNTRIEIHDVVLVNYTLWIEENIVDDQQGPIYVEDPDVIEKVGVPESIIEEFPNVFAPPNLGFVEGILGMRAGEETNHRINWITGKAFNDPNDTYYGENLFYQIRIKKILLDASQPTPTLMDIPFFVPLVVLLGLLIIFLIILRIQRYSRTHNLFGLKKKCYYCGKIANVMCGNPGCTTPYCKPCFLENNGCDLCHSNTMIPLK
ncbi:MAG: hypothetical protein JSW11_21880 [Candidatus Heimdallarchaeota archaeon]|nr:MAG: hypothetical protein JSW11_21880 [Candidatus Heimdallarchaeota archaeon]